MSKVSPFLWYDTQAEEAAKFYTDIFKNSKITTTTHYEGKEVEEVAGKPEGSVMTVAFELDGQPFTAINGGPNFKFTEAVSFVVSCEDQEEVDYFWEKLSDGGEESQCGWLKDKFGLSWQITPRILSELIGDPDPARAERALNAMLKMKKIIVKDIEQAANGE